MRARRPPCIAGREPKPCLDAGPRPPLAFIHCRLDNPSPPLAPSLAGSDLPSQRRWLASMLRCRAAPTCTTPSTLPLPVAGWQARRRRAVAGWQAPLPLRCLAARTSLSLPAVAGWIPPSPPGRHWLAGPSPVTACIPKRHRPPWTSGRGSWLCPIVAGCRWPEQAVQRFVQTVTWIAVDQGYMHTQDRATWEAYSRRRRCGHRTLATASAS